MTDEELENALHDRRQELFNLRFQSATGALENSARLKLAKREIARLLTGPCRTRKGGSEWLRKKSRKRQPERLRSSPSAIADRGRGLRGNREVPPATNPRSRRLPPPRLPLRSRVAEAPAEAAEEPAETEAEAAERARSRGACSRGARGRGGCA